jgi:RNA polymerase sigma-70 factor (ECF subfamily)
MPTPPAPADEMEKYRARVTRYIRYLVKDRSEAEDLAQETMLRAHRQRSTLRDAGALESWLYQIATHVSIDVLRKRAKAACHQVDARVEELPLAEEKRPSPFNIIEQQEMSDCVQRYVSTLGDVYKSVLLLHDADGLTSEEIAGLLGIPVTAVKMRLHRARRRLEIALSNACAFGRDERGVLVCEPKAESKAPEKTE